jgi:hypothetical protein
MQKHLLPILGVTVVAACGGKVIWVGDDSSGGAHASSTGTGHNTAPSSSTGLMGEACASLCAIPACDDGEGDGPKSCVDSCLLTYTPVGCETHADALLQCIVANTDPTCALPAGKCHDQLAAFEKCQDAGECLNGGSGGGETSCQVNGSCFGQGVAQICSLAADGSTLANAG